MGGHAAGEVASRLAADEIIATFVDRSRVENETWPEHWNMARSATANRLVDAILAGHERVTRAVSRDVNLRGMGTTVVAAVHPDSSRSIIICHVGDSRAYRLRKGAFELLTEDHSWVHEQVAAGFLTEEAARSHPLKNVVTQALGGSTEPQGRHPRGRAAVGRSLPPVLRRSQLDADRRGDRRGPRQGRRPRRG